MKKISEYEPMTLESTGYSFSGITDVVNNISSEDEKELLVDIFDKYREAKNRQEELEKELDSVKGHRSTIVGAMVHYCGSKKLAEYEPFVCVHDDKVITMTVKSYIDSIIEYEEETRNNKH